jgi:hypothetical protein
VDWGKVAESGQLSVKTTVTFNVGIPQDKAKALAKQIRDKGLKVNAQIQGEEVRVSGKSKDELQKAMAFIKGLELDYPVAFVNYR